MDMIHGEYYVKNEVEPLKLKDLKLDFPKDKEEYTDDCNKTHGGYSHTEDGKRWWDLEFNQGYNQCREEFMNMEVDIKNMKPKPVELHSTEYNTIHKWLFYKYGRPKVCIMCREKKKCNYAVKFGFGHEKNRSNYPSLCVRCHRRYDTMHKTHCKRGHEYTDENALYTSNGARWCRACRDIHAQAERQKDGRKVRNLKKRKYPVIENPIAYLSNSQ